MQRLEGLKGRPLGGITADRWTRLVEKAITDWESFPWKQFVDKAIPCLFHGDLNFGNMINSGNGRYSLVDWREEFAGLDYGDQYYDLGKLYAGLCVNYDNIREKGCPPFSLSSSGILSAEVPDSQWLGDCRRKLEAFCKKNGLDFKHVRLVAASTFFNMSPLHTPPLDAYFLAVGLRQMESWRVCEA